MAVVINCSFSFVPMRYWLRATCEIPAANVLLLGASLASSRAETVRIETWLAWSMVGFRWTKYRAGVNDGDASISRKPWACVVERADVSLLGFVDGTYDRSVPNHQSW